MGLRTAQAFFFFAQRQTIIFRGISKKNHIFANTNANHTTTTTH